VPALAVLLAAAALAAPPAAPIAFDLGPRCVGRECHPERTELYVVDRIGYPARRLTRNTVLDADPAWSPDRRRIAFVSTVGSNYDIWVMDADGGGRRRLTRDPMVETEPDWSPDGRSIVFRGESADGQTFDLYRMRADGSGRRRVTRNAGALDPAWSPDGRWIAFSTPRGIYRVAPEGTGLRRLALNAGAPSWSPDGRRIAFQRDTPGDSDSFELWTMNPDGSGQRRVTSGPSSVDPTWSPDGRWLAFVRDDQLAVVRAAGGRVKQLTARRAGVAGNPDW
jgi:TolB protein